MSWPFDQTPTTAAITTRYVIAREQPITVVLHYSDDHSWAFLCGTTNDEKDGRVILMREAVEIDTSVLEIANLPPGWKAWRKEAGAPWQRIENHGDA
jgi:hypothetical protein